MNPAKFRHHRRIAFTIMFLFGIIALCHSTLKAQTNSVTEQEESDIWISAYLASWNHFAPPGGNWGNLPTEEIEWEAFTHLIYFAFVPKSDGSLSEVKPYENLSPDRLNSIVTAAHSHNKPVLLAIGGSNSRKRFKQNLSTENRAKFIRNIISTMKRWNFDGIDLDMEPIRKSDTANYITFVNELHEALQNETTPLLDRPLLTAATNWEPQMFSKLHEKFDQINLMTYDMSGAWQGWVSWYNSPLYNGGETFSNGNPLPSVNRKVKRFIDAGIPSQNLGLGIDFYGYIWHGVTAPRQDWTGKAPKVERPGGVPYHELANNYDLSQAQWDSIAKVPYLSVNSPKQFVSFDNERSIKEKINYVRSENLGGAIIWDISGGYRKELPANQRNILLQAVQKMLNK